MSNNTILARIASPGKRGVTLLFDSGETAKARVSSNVFRSVKNPVCGDYAKVIKKQDTWYVEEILKRKGCLERTSPTGRRQTLAANIDLVLIVASIASPPLRPGFIDRALAAAEWNHLPAAIVFNKIDLAGQDSAFSLSRLDNIYKKTAGYSVVETSAITRQGLDEFKNLLHNKTVALAGISAAGKTSLIHAIHPELNLRIGEVNAKTTKGRHTTVSARLIPLGNKSYLMDTPGLRAFAVDHIPKEELKHCFIEFTRYPGCKFRNCLHDTEPGCRVREALAEGEISKERYNSYIKLLHEEKYSLGNS